SFLTCFWLLPQNEHFSRWSASPIRATVFILSAGHRPYRVTVPSSSDACRVTRLRGRGEYHWDTLYARRAQRAARGVRRASAWPTGAHWKCRQLIEGIE